jgi:hypothetical protein
MCLLPTWLEIAALTSNSTFPTVSKQTDLHLLHLRSFPLTTTGLSTSVTPFAYVFLFYQALKRSSRQPYLEQALRLLPHTTISAAVMFKYPFHTVRRSVGRPISLSKRTLRSSAAIDRTMCVSHAVNEFQTAQGTTTAGRIVNKISMRLANDRATTRTEQLIWLAEHALEISTTQKTNQSQTNPFTVTEESPESCDNKTTSTASESTGRQS